jgi:hypothetical protein
MDEGLDEAGLESLLVNEYKCKCDGKPLAPPYLSNDDLPTFFISPTGLHFPVWPPEGTHYPASIIQEIIQAGKLDVVVTMPKKV